MNTCKERGGFYFKIDLTFLLENKTCQICGKYITWQIFLHHEVVFPPEKLRLLHLEILARFLYYYLVLFKRHDSMFLYQVDPKHEPLLSGRTRHVMRPI